MFSVIIPTYNNIELFKRALDSVLKQKHETFEIIVVDDSESTDIEKFISYLPKSYNIQYHHNIPPLGAVSNWNYGIGLAQGDFIILLHHDESLDRDCHLTLLRTEFDKGNDVVISNVKVFIDNKIHKRRFPEIVRSFILAHPTLLFALNVIGPTACVAIRRNICPNFDTKLSWLVDIEWYFRAINKRQLSLRNDCNILSIHGHKGQISETIDIKEALDSDCQEITSKYRNPFITFALKCGKMISSDTIKKIIRKVT